MQLSSTRLKGDNMQTNKSDVDKQSLIILAMTLSMVAFYLAISPLLHQLFYSQIRNDAGLNAILNGFALLMIGIVWVKTMAYPRMTKKPASDFEKVSWALIHLVMCMNIFLPAVTLLVRGTIASYGF
jgi:hypothetical protein